jgi:hypothetical protein
MGIKELGKKFGAQKKRGRNRDVWEKRKVY